jgi:UDP-glucose 4-epimerase
MLMKLTSRKIVVTGGAGFIGSHLVDALAEHHDVVVLDNLSSGKRENLTQALATNRVTLCTLDLRNKEGLDEVLQGAGVVFHLATQCLRLSISSDSNLVHEVNTTGTLNLLRSCLKTGVEKFVYVSSSEVYGTAKSVPMSENHALDPTTIYGASKLSGEVYTRVYREMYGLPSIIVRPFNTYGPRSHFEGYSGEVIPKFVVRVLGGKAPVIFGTGHQTRDFTYVSDVVRGMLLAAKDLPIGEVVNIACGKEVCVQEIADSVIRLAPTPSLGPVYETERPGDVRRHFADIGRARKLLGFSPAVPFQEGLLNYMNWFREEFAERIDECVAVEVERNW